MEILRGKAIYARRFDLSQKDDEIKDLKEQLYKAQTEVDILRRRPQSNPERRQQGAWKRQRAQRLPQWGVCQRV